MHITTSLKRQPLLAYFALVFIFSWSWWGSLLVIAPGGFPGGRAEFGAPALFALLAALGPSLVGVVLACVIDGKEGLRSLFARLGRWRVNLAWYGVALFTTSLLLTAILTVLAFFVSPVLLPWIITTQDPAGVLGFGVVIGLVAGVLEELGWTGFALPRLQNQYKPLTAALILGVIWGVWHFVGDFWGRIDSYGILYLPNFAVFIIEVTAYRILIAWVYNNSQNSLLLAILMHASFSGGQYIFIPPLSPMDSIQVHIVFATVLWLVVALVVVLPERRWTRKPHGI
jgi:membrane protease YdiL (CAAX protease family)